MLGAYRAALEEEPILVVPTFADVDHYRRELAGAGAVFGVRVVAFSGLMREIARRAGVGGGRSRAWRASAWRLPRSPGSAWRRSRRRPPRRASSRPCCASSPSSRSSASSPGAGGPRCGRGASASPRARPTPRSSRACTAPIATACAPSTAATASCTTRRRSTRCAWSPARWGATPVFLYGFDDLQALQRDAIETLAVHAGAPVTVSLAYEPGRAAFAGRGETFQELMALGPEHVELPALRRALRAPRAARARAHAVRAAGVPASRSGRRADAARGRRRARASSSSSPPTSRG